jgi:hypothetical protein
MQFFHGSHQAFPLGYTLRPQKNGYCQATENQLFEVLVESLRPADKLSRSKAVFVCADADLIDAAGGYTDCIYEVEVGLVVKRSDLAWLTEASAYFTGEQDHDLEMAKGLIERYWAGEPYKVIDFSCFEYRTPSAKIIDYLEINMSGDEFKESLKSLKQQEDDLCQIAAPR